MKIQLVLGEQFTIIYKSSQVGITSNDSNTIGQILAKYINLEAESAPASIIQKMDAWLGGMGLTNRIEAIYMNGNFLLKSKKLQIKVGKDSSEVASFMKATTYNVLFTKLKLGEI